MASANIADFPTVTREQAVAVLEHARDALGDKSAAEIFDALGPWAGETTEEILSILAKARRQGGQRSVGDV